MRAILRFVVENRPGAGSLPSPAAQRKFLQDEVERWSGLVARHGVTVD